MKKIFFAALALLVINGTFAQDIRIGIKTGGNLSTLNCDPVPFGGITLTAKMKFGFHAGAFIDFKFNDRLSLQPELLYSAQNSNLYGSATGTDDDHQPHSGSADFSFSFGYINLPVLLKINLPEITQGLSAEIGTQIGFLVSAKAGRKIKSDNVVIDEEKGRDIKEDCKTVDVSAFIGLSYTFAENFVVSARYGLGFTKIFKRDGLVGIADDAKNSVIQLSVGYKF